MVCVYTMYLGITGSYLRPCETSTIERFKKTINIRKQLTIFAKAFVIEVLEYPKYVSDLGTVSWRLCTKLSSKNFLTCTGNHP